MAFNKAADREGAPMKKTSQCIEEKKFVFSVEKITLSITKIQTN